MIMASSTHTLPFALDGVSALVIGLLVLLVVGVVILVKRTGR